MTQVQSNKSAEFQDQTFGKGGVVELPFEGIAGRFANSVLPLPDKKLLLLFNAPPSENSPTKVARLKEDGSLDLRFGNQGTVDVPFKDGVSFSARNLRPLDNGGWLITGTVEHSDGKVDLAVVRQLQDGQLDTSFGPDKDGKVTLNVYDLIGPGAKSGAGFVTRRHDEKNVEKSSASAGDVGLVAVGQQDGKIILVSTVLFAFDYLRGIVVRLNVDGSLDKTFNGKGFVLVELPGITHNWNYASGVAVQHDGKVLVCGDFSRATSDERPDAYVIRYDQYGSVDESYGDNKNGVVTVTDSSRWLDLGSMTLKSDGGVVAVGTAEGEGLREGLVVSLNVSGSFNLVFNNGKPLFSNFTEHGVSWRRCVVQADGKLVVSGQGGGAFLDENSSATTARYTSGGSLDVTFAGKGWVDRNDERGIDLFRGCAVMADNRIVVCGYLAFIPDPATGFVVRYLA
ncbi:NHL repeat-containing protein [Pseudomonas sp. RT6P73]